VGNRRAGSRYGSELAGRVISAQGTNMARHPQNAGDFWLSTARAFQQTHWQPSVDAFRTAQGWLLKYELAGVLPHEVQLSVKGRQVVVRGMRRDVRVDECRQSYCMEISYNQFERVLELPCDLSEMNVATEYRDGMLIVRLTCKETGA
jgi:HSP20 family protein